MSRKLLTFWLIIYILVLVTQPCEDFQEASLARQSEFAVVEISSPIPNDSEPESESCSPFCVCGCCGVSVVHHGLTSLAMTDRITVTESPLVPIYQSPLKNSYVDSIWQPPKV